MSLLAHATMAPLRAGAQARTLDLLYAERLAFMKDLTPVVFATVKRQCVLLGEELDPEAWLDQLDLKVRAKARGASGGTDLGL